MKYRVYGLATVSCWTDVEADSEAEALEVASWRGLAGLCHQPFDSDSDESFHFDADGEVTDLHVEQA